MRVADLEEVLLIERASFSRPWSVGAFLSELALPYSHYLVARPAEAEQVVGLASPPSRSSWRRSLWLRLALADRTIGSGEEESEGPSPGPLLGYAGLQVLLDEGHVMNLAVHPGYRRRGIGELLLLHLFKEAKKRGAERLTLEVRVSNLAAQALYEKYGFQESGRRKRYYGDGEDALIMWTDRLETPAMQARLVVLWEQLRANLQPQVMEE
ncbi:MAG: ribosomal protein S18-alanine N-acetyltransferase [Chloroflexia bacterium]|nr:ribosomal protein S18-alanine N-acetyltransferase [Chloroflexia bacterium]